MYAGGEHYSAQAKKKRNRTRSQSTGAATKKTLMATNAITTAIITSVVATIAAGATLAVNVVAGATKPIETVVQQKRTTLQLLAKMGATKAVRLIKSQRISLKVLNLAPIKTVTAIAIEIEVVTIRALNPIIQGHPMGRIQRIPLAMHPIAATVKTTAAEIASLVAITLRKLVKPPQLQTHLAKQMAISLINNRY